MRFSVAAFVPLSLLFAGCGGGGSASSTSPAAVAASATAGAAAATNQYASAYQQAKWGSATTVSFPSSCSMLFHTTGVPPFHADYYLAPVSSAYPTAVAVTPLSNTQMSVVPYTPASITAQTIDVNTCPAKAASTTATNMGPIGYAISGEAIYNSYEGGGTSIPAMSDNVSYTFTTSSGTSETASFIDACNSHPTPLANGYTWHHHGVPSCLVAQLDGSSGPSHLIGFALDGFPIYGGRDINGNAVAVSQLDACNGITSATPEFPSGAYHYVLPVGVTGKQSSLNCYAGTVSEMQMAIARKLMCGMNAYYAQLARAANGRRRVRKADG